MTSLRRHNTCLDAARQSLLDVGWKRTTLTDVARRAGVSRMTIYRTWPDMESLLGDLMTREWAVVAASVPVSTAATKAPRRIAENAVAVAGLLRANDLFRRILDVDPELLLPYLLERRGRVQAALLVQLVEEIRAGQQAGEVREGHPDLIARTLLLATHGVTFSAGTMVDEAVSTAELDRELATFLAAGLAP